MRKKSFAVLLIVAMLFAMIAANIPAFAADHRSDQLEVLVGFQGSPNPGLVRAFGGEIYAEFTLVDVIAVRMTAQQARALSGHPAIRYIEPDGMVYAIQQTVPWGIDRVFNGSGSRINTWQAGKAGLGISAFVLDTGIDRNHEDLTVVGGRRFYTQGPFLRNDDKYDDGHGHGTHVAGTIGALDNDVGVVGVAPAVDLYAVKVLTDNGSGSVSAIIAGIEWSVNQKEENSIINMSLGSSSYSRAFEDACQAAYDAGLLVVSSAGNTGNTGGTGDNVGYPAKYASVIAVAASDSENKRASFSSTGPDVEVIAPGVSVLSTVPGGYATYSGTSMASPHAAGVAALVWAADKTLSNVEVRDFLSNNTEDLSLPAEHQGNGLVRADMAVAAVLGTEPPATYSLSLAASPENAGNVTGDGSYTEGTSINITATANMNYIFDKWTDEEGLVISNDANFSFIMPDKDVTLTANFIEEQPPIVNQYDLTISSSAGGVVTFPGEGFFNYDEGTVVNLKAVPNEGYQFVNWTGDTATIADATAAETSIAMNADYSITANFEEFTAPPSVEIVSVESVIYTTSGGRNQDRHLHVALALKDDLGNAVSGALVSIDLARNNSTVLAATGTTDTNGTVTFSYNNAPSGTYTTKVTAVNAAGLTWDLMTPSNTYDK